MVTTVGQIVALFSVLCRNCRNQAIANYLGEQAMRRVRCVRRF